MAHVAGLGDCPEHKVGPVQMEMRYKEVDRARNIFERYVRCIPTVKSYVRYAKFEMRNGDVTRSRRSYERAVEELGEDAQTVRPSPALKALQALIRQQSQQFGAKVLHCHLAWDLSGPFAHTPLS